MDTKLHPIGSDWWQGHMRSRWLWESALQSHFIVLKRLFDPEGKFIGYDWQVGRS